MKQMAPIQEWKPNINIFKALHCSHLSPMFGVCAMRSSWCRSQTYSQGSIYPTKAKRVFYWPPSGLYVSIPFLNVQKITAACTYVNSGPLIHARMRIFNAVRQILLRIQMKFSPILPTWFPCHLFHKKSAQNKLYVTYLFLLSTMVNSLLCKLCLVFPLNILGFPCRIHADFSAECMRISY